MLNVEDPYGPERREEGQHDRWLAMQSAYAEYRRASEVLESTPQFTNELPASQRLRLIMWEGQRVAFERYLDARMGFLESWFAGSNSRGAGPEAAPQPEAEYSRVGSWRAFPNCLPALQILAIILLCMTAFSFIGEQKQMRAVEAVHHELQATLKQNRDALQPHAQKRNVAVAPQLSAVVHLQSKQVAAKRTPVLQTRSQRSGIPAYYSFSLAPSHDFKRVGPIRLSVRSMNAQQKRVSLSILSDPMQMDVPSLQLNQPVWIDVGYPKQPVELVVDKIAGNRLEGHLVEPRSNKTELSAGQLRSNFPASP